MRRTFRTFWSQPITCCPGWGSNPPLALETDALTIRPQVPTDAPFKLSSYRIQNVSMNYFRQGGVVLKFTVDYVHVTEEQYFEELTVFSQSEQTVGMDIR